MHFRGNSTYLHVSQLGRLGLLCAAAAVALFLISRQSAVGFLGINRVFKNRPKYDLKSNQIICQKIDLKSQSNRHFPK
jgi:hypothetical protein